MATATKIRVVRKTVGWHVYFTHPEAEGIAVDPTMIAGLLVGVTGPRVAPILVRIPSQTWAAVCSLSGHVGVHAVVTFYPEGAALLPRLQ